MGKGSRNKQIRYDEQINQEKQEALLKILESSKFTFKEKVRIILIKVFLRGRMKKVCRDRYNFKYGSQNKMFKKVLRDTYTEGIVLNNLADFHLMGTTKCGIRNTNWKLFLTDNGKIKR